MRIAWWMGGLLVAASTLGCGSSADSAPGAGAPAASAAGGTVPAGSAELAGPQASASPDQVVACFYEALRRGDDGAIASLLTDRARQETANNGLGVQSQASAGLEYEIREMEIVTPAGDGAHVRSFWNERDEQGALVSTEVIWVLRRQADGWRISGMATPVLEGSPPLLFNFEDPQDMLAKKDFIESQLAGAGDADAEAGSAEPAVAEAAPDAGAVRVAEPLASPLDASGVPR